MATETPPETPTQTPTAPSRRRWALGGAAVVILGAGAITATVLLSGSDTPRGEASAQLAARKFVAAANAGDKDAAAALACPNFADQARSVATAGADANIDYVLTAVHIDADGRGDAVITQRLTFSPGNVQREQHTVRLDESGGRWLLCGDA